MRKKKVGNAHFEKMKNKASIKRGFVVTLQKNHFGFNQGFNKEPFSKQLKKKKNLSMKNILKSEESLATIHS